MILNNDATKIHKFLLLQQKNTLKYEKGSIHFILFSHKTIPYWVIEE